MSWESESPEAASMFNALLGLVTEANPSVGLRIPEFSLGQILPLIILCAAAVVVLLLDAFVERARPATGYLALAALLVSIVFVFSSPASRVFSFPGILVTDGFSLFFDAVFVTAAVLSILLSIGKKPDLNRGEYHALILFAVTGQMVMAHSVNLLSIFLGLEILSISVYVLTGFVRTNRRSAEAAMKYFLLGAFSSAFFIYASALVYGTSGSLEISAIAGAYAKAGSLAYLPLVGFGLLIVAFGFKISSVPFHMWTPDAYDGAPTPIAAFMSAGTKAAAFAALIRVLFTVFGHFHTDWWLVLWILSVATMTVGNLIAIAQRNLKRMLAFSSIAHAGYILIGCVVMTEESISGMLYYLIAYAFMNIGAFGIIAALERKGAPEEEFSLSKLSGLGFSRPLPAFGMALFMFSLAGIPPTGGFFAKLAVFSAAVKAHYYWLVVLGVLNSAMAAYYYLRVVVTMYMNRPIEGEEPPPRIVPAETVSLALASLGTLVLGVFPNQVMDYVVRGVEILAS
jgi:NADH-quinone oxidoreductase subunit N